jgi:hypothetical protein
MPGLTNFITATEKTDIWCYLDADNSHYGGSPMQLSNRSCVLRGQEVTMFSLFPPGQRCDFIGCSDLPSVTPPEPVVGGR